MHIFSIIAFLLPALGAFAGSCSPDWSPCRACGKIKNNTGYNIKITKNPSNNNSKTTTARPHWCDIFNWSGTAWSNPHSCPNRPCICKQETLGPHKTIGGNRCSSPYVDPDAFCLADRDYVLVQPGGGSRRVRKGVWTRIHDDETAECNYGVLDGSGTAYCKIIKD
ncbi:hypothetical protein M501DRAFT_1035343 [Patellaria atrata CBS 101060]|uniref:Cyanovirin-N domain-containing protein n=1 Tax=Patellaria atrata CBS 101060 TaxID=1346257 RepID=A0A9P4S302_9PEZI|nr:hypothetical protein M501DRAFT_1035343 [Patellaria atrata CBS 101060]